jgi:hypothetical protein
MPPKTSKKEVVIVAAPRLKKSTKKAKVVTTTIKGRGDYRPTSFTRVRGRGDYLGDLLGGVGSKLGNAAQGMFRDLTGFGNYRSHGPVSNSISQMVGRAADTSAQNFGTAGPSENPFVMGAMSVKFSGKAPRIQHREFISDVIVPASGSSFSTTAYNIQPGLSGIGTLFPWGSSVFGNFENYILHGMVLEYATTSSNFSASSALGTVSMSTVYDAESPILANLKAVNNNEFTTSAPPCASFYHPIECSPKEGATNVKFVRKNNLALATDTRFDDVGIFQLSLDGISAPPGTAIGQLWASYDIEVLKAVLPDAHVGTTAAWTFPLQASGGVLFNGPIANPANSLPATLTVTNGGSNLVVQMPVGYNGNYMLIVYGAQNSGFTVTQAHVYKAAQPVGSDITPLAMFPTGSAALSGECASYAEAITPVFAYGYAFSTIVETLANNVITLAWIATGATAPFRTSMFIVPLDNDVTDSQSFLSGLLRKQPALAKIAALMAQNQTTLQSQASFLPATLFPPPQAADTNAGRYAVPASMQLPAAGRIKREGQQNPQDTDDQWVSLRNDSLAAGTTEPATPPNSGHSESPAQSIAQAEQALAAAIRAATLRAGSLHPYLSTIED